MDNTYMVYKHTAPNGKVYIGITKYENPVLRWGRTGNGYKSNKHFYAAIQKYGWNNIKHEIIASGLSRLDACALESQLIEKYDATNSECGYNGTLGGEANALYGSGAACLSAAKLAKYAAGFTQIWVNNGTVETYICPDQVDEYAANGYVRGRLQTNSKYVHKGNASKKVPEAMLPAMLDDGWVLGRAPSTMKRVNESHFKFVYHYKGKTFRSGIELASYLNCHGYPKIVPSTVTAIACGKVYRSAPELNDDIIRVPLGGK